MMTELLTRMDIRKMYLNDRHGNRRNRITDCYAVMRIGCCIQNNERILARCLLQRIHKCSLVVRLQKISLQSCLCRTLFQHGIDILQGRVPVNFRFPGSEQVQIWSMKH